MSRTKLTLKELYKLSNFAADLYRAPDRAALAHKIATLAGQALCCDHSGTWEVNIATLEEKATYPLAEAGELAVKSWPVYTHYARRYPIFTEPMRDPKFRGKVFRASEFVPHTIIEPIGFLDEYAKPNFCEFQLIYYFNQDGPRSAFLTVSRGTRDYSDQEKSILEFLAPHFQAAYEHTGALEDQQASLARAKAVREALPVECIWIDGDLKVKEVSPRIPELLREFFQMEFTAGALPEKIMAWLRSFLPLGSIPALAPLVIQHADAILKIRLYPERLPGLHLVTLSRRVTKPTLEHLKPLGLTRRESEILLWVAHAKTNDEIGRMLGCSTRTIAKHMEHLLLKLQVENRSAAMLLVADLLQG
jgi:DNA-binding CsgD family transcriptional regulator